MDLSESPRSAIENQKASQHTIGPQCLTRRPRMRLCLLKGCERRYRPRQGLQRYCGNRCREAAREWSLWKAQARYRATATGKEKRRARSQRYRRRVRRKKPHALATGGTETRVISAHFFGVACDRPGCYESFVWTRRSPLQRFCSNRCRRALERVRERERRWQESPPTENRR
jgi:hypothetical protein